MKHILLLLTITLSIRSLAQTPVYKDPKQPVDLRVKDLLKRMTIEEKFFQLFMIPGDLDNAKPDQYKNGLFGFQVSAGAAGDISNQLLNYNTTESASTLAKKINSIQKYFVEKSRLGIPIIAFDEALHGLVREGATAFPQAIALAATWDTSLVHRVAGGIANETKLRGIRQILSPVVNLANDVRWGRTEETYGEDPFLTTAMGMSFITAFEKSGIVTTPKHFIANVGEGGRDSYPIHFNHRFLEETHLVPFKAIIRKGGARSIMTAYNSLDGQASSANHWLLIEKLKKEWGFTGFVISDANAVGGEVVLHNTAKDYAASGEHAINNGLDVIFQTEFKHHELFIPAFLDNRIDTLRLNDAVTRVLKIKFELGLFENPYVSEHFDDKKLLASNQQLAALAAKESFVLLKNINETLPLSPKIKSITVVGYDAKAARLGGYSGKGNTKVSILDGLQQAAGNRIRISYAPGPGLDHQTTTVIADSFFLYQGKPGLFAEYFDNVRLTGKPMVERVDRAIDFRWTLFGPAAALSNDFYSARWKADLIAPATGIIKIGLEGNDGYRLYINDQLVIDNWQKQSYHTSLKEYSFIKGKKYAIRVEFFESGGNATIKLIWNYGIKDNAANEIAKAVALAKETDLVIVTAGIKEGEFNDRAYLSLPGKQEELILQLTKTGKPVIVLLIGGSAITMNNWIDKVAAVGMCWYPGEQGGKAIADILTGKYNPSGKLPITFPVTEAQLPLVYHHKPTGRGDDYNNLTGLPLFPFGYGLSYTQFLYDDLQLQENNISQDDSATVSFTITNTGSRDGEEVVQLYIRDVLSSVARPVIELKGFQRVYLNAGEKKTISFKILPEYLVMLDKDMKSVIEPGDFHLLIGSSSRDIRLKTTLTVK